MRSVLCAAALFLIPSASWAERIDPVAAHAVRDVHQGTLTLTVEFSRPPDLLSDRITLGGVTSDNYPFNQFSIGNYSPPQAAFRLRSSQWDVDVHGEEYMSILQDWTPIAFDLNGSTLSIELAYESLEWESRALSEWIVSSRSADTSPVDAVTLEGTYAIFTPEPSSVVLAGIGVGLFGVHRLLRRRPRANRRACLGGGVH